MTRLAFFKLLSIVGFFQFKHPVQLAPSSNEPECLGVVDGIPIEIECPPETERCPLSHLQIPRKIYPVEWDPKMQAQYYAIEPLFHACSTCGIVYAPKAIDKSPPSK